MSNHSIEFHIELISSFSAILLIGKQTDTGENINSFCGGKTSAIYMGLRVSIQRVLLEM